MVTEGGAGVGVRDELVPRSLNLKSVFFQLFNVKHKNTNLCSRPSVHTRTNKRDKLMTSLVDNKSEEKVRVREVTEKLEKLPADLTLVSLFPKTPKRSILDQMHW